MFSIFFLLFVAVQGQWNTDPKHCEVCVKVIADIHASVKQLHNKKSLPHIESLIDAYCSKTNKKAGPRERKLCYYIQPVKRMISTPLSFGADAKEVCKKLERASAEVCTVKYPIQATEKTPLLYEKMRVRHLKQVLRDRGVACRGCVDKRQYIQKCKETEHLQYEM